MGCLFRTFFVLLFLAAIGLPAAAVVFGLDRAPMLPPTGDITLADMQRAHKLVERYDPRRMTPNELTVVTATADELNALIKGGVGMLPRVSSRVDINRFGMLAGVSAELPIPENPLGRYVNVRAAIAPSEDGLNITRLAVGRIELPPAIVRPAVRLALDRYVGPDKGQPIVDSIRSVRVQDDRLAIAFRPPPALVEDFKAAAKRQMTVSHPRTVRAYYEHLLALHARQGGRQTSLAAYVKPLFQLARQRSETRDAARENEGAVIALAMFFGDPRFERFVGEVRTPEMRDRGSIGRVVLDGRHDFLLHFAISAGLALTGGDAAANLIGEIKEVKDSSGASGFSFNDIGADRAGVRFARQAVSGQAAAQRFQERLAALSGERDFFPPVADLPEGLSVAEFRSRYGDVNSPAYKRMIDEIDRRIDAIPLYR